MKPDAKKAAELARQLLATLAQDEQSEDDDWSTDFAAVLPAPVRHGAYVYFILCESPDRQVKIGHGRNLSVRLTSLQCGCPYRLRFVAYFFAFDAAAIEATLHRHLAPDLVAREWFSGPVTRRLVSTIRSCMREGGVPSASSFVWRGKERRL